jgi:hypothetical protein
MDKLADDDISLFFEVHPKLLDFLFEETAFGRCTNLAYYRKIAKAVLDDLQKGTASIASNSQGYERNWHARQSRIADAIRTHKALKKMIQEQKLFFETDRICQAYARLVLNHEDDKNCDLILRGLRSKADELSPKSVSSGFPSVPADGTCS